MVIIVKKWRKYIMDSYFVYIVKCSDGSLYIGYVKDVNVCVEKYNWG